MCHPCNFQAELKRTQIHCKYTCFVSLHFAGPNLTLLFLFFTSQGVDITGKTVEREESSVKEICGGSFMQSMCTVNPAFGSMSGNRLADDSERYVPKYNTVMIIIYWKPF